MARRALTLALLALPVTAGAHGFEPTRVTVRELGEGVVVVDTVRRNQPDAPDAEPTIELPARCVALDVPSAVWTPRGPIERWTARCGPRGLAGERVGASFPVAHDLVLQHVLRDGRSVTRVLRPSRPVVTLPRSPQGRWETFFDALAAGARHVLEGADHLLFLAVLALSATGPRRLAWTVTGFTLGHALTLGIALGGSLTVPAAPVEALIAWTILVAARPVALGDPRPAVGPAVAAAFGLVHGMGIATALGDIGLGADRATVLAGINLGVEGAQLAVILLARALWSLARRAGLGARAQRVAGYAVGAVAGAWLVARAASLG